MATVDEVMSNDVLEVDEHATLGGVARAIQARNVGAAIVTGEDGAPVGIITERDLIRAVAASRHPDQGQAGSWMTAEVVTVQCGTSVEDAATLMLERNFRHLPVADGERLVGIVSIRDLLGHSRQ